MLSFIPYLVDRSARIHAAVGRLTTELLPKQEPLKPIKLSNSTAKIHVVILDGHDWHLGATAPRLTLPRAYAGSCGP